MLVFVSWSGDRSKAVAEILQQWIQEVIQVVEPWMSTDMEKGGRWMSELNTKLEASKAGILCLSAKSLNSPWIYFEAGALAKTHDASLYNVLIDISPNDLAYPLAQFQNTSLNEVEIRQLIGSLNRAVIRAGESGLAENVLGRVFDRNWERLQQELLRIANTRFQDEAPAPIEPLDMLGELIGMVMTQGGNGIPIEVITQRVLNTMQPRGGPPMQPAMLAMLAREIQNKHLAKILGMGLAIESEGQYRLTDAGREYFSRSSKTQKDLLRKMLAAMKPEQPGV
jgi:hypothetical protein